MYNLVQNGQYAQARRLFLWINAGGLRRPPDKSVYNLVQKPTAHIKPV